jgi:formate dehydrogenase-N alpha subunit
MPLVDRYLLSNAFYHELRTTVNPKYGKEKKSVELNRRDFIKLSGVGTGGFLLYGLLKPEAVLALPDQHPLRKKRGETTTVCPYCGVGCGVIMAVEDGKIVNIEGDPDSPISEGSLCSKGASVRQVANNAGRLTKVKHRAAGAADWEDLSWENAITKIAARIKSTRDSSFIETDSSGNTVNRTEAIASVGSVFPTSEEAYLMSKTLRSLGLVYIENGARICVSSAVAADIETVGRGPMSNHWIDLSNSDCIMVIGSNIAEVFPVAFKWVIRAMKKGTKLIHVDPRFTRTSAKADLYAAVRPSTDIAFTGGMIRYVINDMEANPGSYNLNYVREYTNASYLVDPNFTSPADTLDGLFSGWDGGKYDKSTWAFQSDSSQPDNIKKDPTLTDPNCVFQLLKKHFARYTDDKVVEITGTDKSTYQKICQTYAATGQTGKAGALFFSSSACQRSTGTQTVRAFGILQLLLGNIGVAGGGLDGITGAPNGLGCTLQGLVNHWGPGADSVRPASSGEQSLAEYGANKARFTSILKAWYGDTDHNTSFNYLPKRDGDYSWQPLFKAIDEGTIKGLISWGMNPAVSGPNAIAARRALRKLEWIIVIDLWETETAAIWKPESGANPADVGTEVFLLPAAHSLEKEGSVNNSSRWNQWRHKGVEPPGEARSDLWIISKLMMKLKELYAGQNERNAEAITNLTWDYGDPPDVLKVTKEMNGYDLSTGKLLTSPGSLKDDGSTSCGNWLWCGMYTEDGNMATRRDATDPSGIGLFPNWGWAWPLNRRIMYNRASVDLDGKPWDTGRPVISWDGEKWAGDIADGGAPPINMGGGYPFVMKPEGRGYLFGPGRADGPFPEHYESWESPVSNPMSPQQNNPAIKSWETLARGTAPDYPILAFTLRIVEHFDTGAITRHMPWLLEMVPEMFVEMSQELAAEKGIAGGDTIIVESTRGTITAKAIITIRLKPMQVNGNTVHHIGLPWHWGYMGLSKGDSANMITPRVGDPNTGVPEFRSFLCNVRKA